MQNKKFLGHIYALITVFIWGVTFISTKLLLVDFSPLEILIVRFLMAWGILVLVDFKAPRKRPILKSEALFMGAGLTGVCLYFLLENIALQYTSASNVGVIAATAPFFTFFFSYFFLKDESFTRRYLVGFSISLVGILFISFGHQSGFEFSLKGDLLALLACISWGMYSVFIKKISELKLSVITTTKKIFFYGLVFMFVSTLFLEFNPKLTLLLNGYNLSNLLFLGAGASALCFVMWNRSIALLGAIKTSGYIYLMPVFTIITSVLVLKESLTVELILGSLLAILGLLVSEGILIKKNKHSTK